VIGTDSQTDLALIKLILEIDHQPVKDAQDAVNDTAKPFGHETLVRVWSHGSIRYISVPESNAG
jgi:hypothetical protein